MMNIYIYEDQHAMDLEPLALTRAVFDIRFGAETFFENIQRRFPKAKFSLFVRDELKQLTSEIHSDYEVNPPNIEEGLWLSGNVIWNEEPAILMEKKNTVFSVKNYVIGANLSKQAGQAWIDVGGPTQMSPNSEHEVDVDATHCRYLWEILDMIPSSVQNATKSLPLINPSNFPNAELINPSHIYVDDAEIQPMVLIDAEKGSVIIENGVKIYGQTYLEGPLFIGRGTVIKPLTQIKNSVIGPMCRIGGEVDTVLIQGFTNKVHDGHLGDAVLGEWVNLGAGTVNSNLKNNYTEVSVQVNDSNINTGSIHIGCFIGDHVKTAIGTCLNTGTVIGPGTMVSTNGFPPKTIRPFTWYVNGRHRKVLLDKFLETAYHVKKRRGTPFSDGEKSLFKCLHDKR